MEPGRFVIYANPSLRANPESSQNTRGQSGLWGYSFPATCRSAAADGDAANIDLAHSYRLTPTGG